MADTDRRALTVRALTRMIKDDLEDHFSDILVDGEISNLTKHSSGHCYFTLKDKYAQIRSILFKGSRRRVKFDLEEGQQVVCSGRLSLYEQRGEYSLIVDTMEPKGVGSLQLAFEQLKKRLGEEGLFSEEQKKPLPFLPMSIGIITSCTGAAVRDIISVLSRRFPSVNIILYPSIVQGDAAAASIASGIEWFNCQKNVELIIAGRGGGSLEDLWAFNEEVVARAIFASELPVISAVGHEVDFSIADFVADVRAPTPSAAAEIAVRDRAVLIDRVNRLQKQIYFLHSSQLCRLRASLENCARLLARPGGLVEGFRFRLDEILLRVSSGIRQVLSEKRGATERLSGAIACSAVNVDRYRLLLSRQESGLLRAVQQGSASRRSALRELVIRLSGANPATMLARGYAKVSDENDNTVRSVAQVEPGMKIGIRLSDAKITAVVNSTGRQERTVQRKLF